MCANHLMARPFHLFPSCGHKFHTDCLTEAVKPHLSLARQRRLEELLQDLASRKNENDDVQSIDSKQEPMNYRTVHTAKENFIMSNKLGGLGKLAQMNFRHP